MRYGIMDQQRVNSPLEGRALGVRHSGGGAVNTGMFQSSPMGEWAPGPLGGLSMGGMNPGPGTLSFQNHFLNANQPPPQQNFMMHPSLTQQTTGGQSGKGGKK